MLNIRYLKLILLTILFIVSFIFVLLPYKILSIAQSRQNLLQRRVYETVFSLLNCFAAGVFLATCFLDLLPEVRNSMTAALKLYKFPPKSKSPDTNDDEFPFSEFVVIAGVFLILLIEQVALVFKEKYIKQSRLSSIKKQDTKDENQNDSETQPLLHDVDQFSPIKQNTYGSFREDAVFSESINSEILRPSTSLLHKICGSIDNPTPSGTPFKNPDIYDNTFNVQNVLNDTKTKFEAASLDSNIINFHSSSHDAKDNLILFKSPNDKILKSHVKPGVTFSSLFDGKGELLHQSKQLPSTWVDSSKNQGYPNTIVIDKVDGVFLSGGPNNENFDQNSAVPNACEDDCSLQTQKQRTTGSVQQYHHHHHPVHHLSADSECGHPKFRLYILVLSLAIHSLFEGMALALQPTATAILGLFGALCFHKVTVAFSLGLNLVQSSLRLWPQIITCGLIFASMSPLGIALTYLLDVSSNSLPFPVSTSLAPPNYNYEALIKGLSLNANVNKSLPQNPPFWVQEGPALKFLFEIASNLKEMALISTEGSPLDANSYSAIGLRGDLITEPPSGVSQPKPWVLLTSAVLQGIACGTFLYITFFELLPHEMNSSRNRLLKVAFLILGYSFVTGFIVYDSFSPNPGS